MSVYSTAEVKVVITSYRRPAWLREAVDSALNQVGVRVHVVIVDDNSDDDSTDVIADLVARDPTRITAVLKARNRGVADSVRLGIESGPPASYTAFLNDDDRWLPDKLQRQLGMFRADPGLSACFSDAYVIDADGERTGALYSHELGPFFGCEFAEIFRADPVCVSTLVLRGDLARRIAATMPHDALAHDFYMALVCAGVGTLVRDPEPLGEYRVSAGAVHMHADKLARSTTEVRVAAMADYPELRDLAGGGARARRWIALATLTEALRRLEAGDLREFAWHSSVVVRQRQLRPIAWLVIHGLRTLLGRGPMRA